MMATRFIRPTLFAIVLAIGASNTHAAEISFASSNVENLPLVATFVVAD